MDITFQYFNRRRQLEDRRTDTLERNFIVIRNAIPKKIQENVGINAKFQTMGVVESKKEIGAVASYLGLELGT